MACFTQNSLENDSFKGRVTDLANTGSFQVFFQSSWRNFVFHITQEQLCCLTHCTLHWAAEHMLPLHHNGVGRYVRNCHTLLSFSKLYFRIGLNSWYSRTITTYHHTDLHILEHSSLMSVSHFNQHSKNTRNSSKYVFSLLNHINTYCGVNVLCTL